MAIGTIATADAYVGRFAPSPTGALHLGSLTAAVGSYLEARRQRGQWRLRIEDLDTARNVPGSADRILGTLESFGFEWDGPVVYQSANLDRYRDALDELARLDCLFACACTRRLRTSNAEFVCQQDCRLLQLTPDDHALRFAIAPAGAPLDFIDTLQGPQSCPRAAHPDVIVRRRDGVIAYQLAVVVDDHMAGVTNVVRGADLQASTAWQIGLQQALGLPTPRYMHLPVLAEADGGKLAKSRRAVPLDPARAPEQLYDVLQRLRQAPPESLIGGSLAEHWQWAEDAWTVRPLEGVKEIRL